MSVVVFVILVVYVFLSSRDRTNCSRVASSRRGRVRIIPSNILCRIISHSRSRRISRIKRIRGEGGSTRAMILTSYSHSYC